MAQDQEAANRIAPFIPFSTFTTALQVLEQGIPERVDKSVFRSMAYSMQPHVVSTLKFFQLIDEEGVAQPELRRLVAETDNRKALMKELIEARYPKLVELGAKQATQAQLDAAIRELGVKGDDTVRKAISFYRKACAYADVPLSPHWPGSKPGPRAASGASRRPRRQRRAKPNDEEGPRGVQPPPALGDGAVKIAKMLEGPIGWLYDHAEGWTEDQMKDWREGFLRLVRLQYPPRASAKRSKSGGVPKVEVDGGADASSES